MFILDYYNFILINCLQIIKNYTDYGREVKLLCNKNKFDFVSYPLINNNRLKKYVYFCPLMAVEVTECFVANDYGERLSRFVIFNAIFKFVPSE